MLLNFDNVKYAYRKTCLYLAEKLQPTDSVWRIVCQICVTKGEISIPLSRALFDPIHLWRKKNWRNLGGEQKSVSSTHTHTHTHTHSTHTRHTLSRLLRGHVLGSGAKVETLRRFAMHISAS